LAIVKDRQEDWLPGLNKANRQVFNPQSHGGFANLMTKVAQLQWSVVAFFIIEDSHE
jgi:hypothetical protein